MNLTITFANYFYSKYYCGCSMASADAKGEATGPARFRSLDFGERNGYLREPTRFRSLGVSKHNGYLKGVATIDAQQKSMELLTFSCSRGSSWVGRYYRGMAATVGRNLIKLYELAKLSSCRRGTLHRHDPE